MTAWFHDNSLSPGATNTTIPLQFILSSFRCVTVVLSTIEISACTNTRYLAEYCCRRSWSTVQVCINRNRTWSTLPTSIVLFSIPGRAFLSQDRKVLLQSSNATTAPTVTTPCPSPNTISISLFQFGPSNIRCATAFIHL